MFKIARAVTLPFIAIIALVGCGKNPFGPGAVGLSMFAKIAKAIDKPSAINKEESSKDSSKAMITEGQGAAKRLAKSLAGSAQPVWIVGTPGLVLRNDTAVYFENVLNKPNDEDPYKWSTGRGEVAFKYTGNISNLTLDSINPALITDIYSFHFLGRETKTWSGEVDSVEFTVTFETTTLNDLKPGKTTAWGKNISASIDLGLGDTAFFSVDSLDDVDHIQFGQGHFYDAHSGRDNSEGPKAFDFNVQVLHKNSLDPSKPYTRYQDNEGIMSFYLPWGTSGDSLYFTVHFYPPYSHPDFDREGTIRKNGPDGARLVYFKIKEMTGAGEVIYYDETGKEIGNE